MKQNKTICIDPEVIGLVVKKTGAKGFSSLVEKLLREWIKKGCK